ncbi:uncharacterized protein LOC101894463 [Musca domestica]|uniref:Uncharacterized protein LOC101894463 n=1 Tax=Musca domestica TaxID=7370 RepID=A0A9J7D1J5_MUSDO|nr:uncharacterized protein LOC101894463 [Musca domestica]
MPKSSTLWIAFVMALSPWFCGIALADDYAECEGKDNRYIASPKGCSNYIFCYGHDSFEGNCDEDAPYFSEDEQTCDVNPEVCANLELTQSGEEGGDAGAEGSEEESNPEGPQVEPIAPVEQPSNVATQAPTATSAGPSPAPTFSPTSSPPGPTFVPTTFKPSTGITGTFAPSTAKPAPTGSSISTPIALPDAKCPAVDDPSNLVFLQNPKSCSDYFMCYHGEPIAMHCSHSLHFDIKTHKCDYPENVQCQLHFFSPREKCQAHTVDVFPHPTNCNYYYMCRLGYLLVMQCPPNMDWDYNRNVCVLRGRANCYSNVNRQSNNWNLFLN